MILKTTGDKNTAFGNNAGNNLTTGSNNLLLGNNANVNSGGAASNKLVIETEDSNSFAQLVLGDFATNNLKFNAGLEINNISTQTIPFAHQLSGLRLTKLPLTSTALPNTSAPLNNKFLTVNATGDVILQNLPTGSAGTAAIVGGTNTTVTGTGATASPYVVNAKNIYTDNGTLTSTRTVTMGRNNLIFDTSASDPITGKIYVGNTAAFPTETGNYKLYVEGGILTEKVKVAMRSTTNWADYVFASDYKLTPLKEVEVFINKNKHLPGISSADELVKNGLDLADMQAKQMQKIEELTLYAIKQNKEIEDLKLQVKLLLDRK